MSINLARFACGVRLWCAAEETEQLDRHEDPLGGTGI